MILFCDRDGNITSISTWTLANSSTYAEDGYLLIDGVGQRPLLPDSLAFDFQPDASPAMASLALEIEGNQKAFQVRDSKLLRDGAEVRLDFVPGIKGDARWAMTADPEIVAFFDMTNEQLVGYVAANYGYTTRQAAAFVVIRNVLRGMARAAGLARR